jgi:shikimate 5-dehydrogenase
MTVGPHLDALPRTAVFGLEVTAPTKELAMEVRQTIEQFASARAAGALWTIVRTSEKSFEFRSDRTDPGNLLFREAHRLAAEFHDQGVEGEVFDGSRKPRPAR